MKILGVLLNPVLLGKASSLHSMLITNRLTSPAHLSFEGSLLCSFNAKLGHGVLAVIGISDA